jgi:valyl-tRNA synthetase
MAIAWFEARYNQVLEQIETHFEHFRISDALIAIYKLIWDDFCAWYLEMIKPAYGESIARDTYMATVDFLERLLKLLHPFMPFITEEIWHQLKERIVQDCMIVASWPQAQSYDQTILQEASLAFELITQIRHIKVGAQIPFKESVQLDSLQAIPSWLARFMLDVQKMAVVREVKVAQTIPPEAVSFSIQGQTFFILLQQPTDQAQETDRLEKELVYYQGFLEIINKKLSNERFLQGASESVLAMEYSKQKDVTAKIKLLKERLLQKS